MSFVNECLLEKGGGVVNTNEQILAELRDRIGTDRELDFMSIYKGVPLIFKGQLQGIEEGTASFRVQPPESVSLTWDAHTTILDEYFLSGVRARVVEFDIHSGVVKLENFNYSERGFGERAIARAKLDEPIEVQIDDGEKSYRAVLMDISLTGFGVRVDLPRDAIPAKGTMFNFQFQLLGRDLEIPGTLLDVEDINDHFRLAISFQSDVPGQALIAQFITRRRADIRQEIQYLYDQASQT
jgi:hypothetical protein